ncbi:AMP-binding protein [Allokutzneria sp. A3M-2-11 16]|nr:AMP-binding protein [Allokutzneria sp. A3M-2-11 16]
MTIGRLATEVDRFACVLVAEGVGRGDLVGFLSSTGPQVLVGIVGVTAAGAAVSVIPTPAAMRDSDQLADRLVTLVDAGQMRFLLTDQAQRPLAELIRSRRPALVVLETPSESGQARDLDIALPRASPEDIAVVQYTSGSTSAPKGVVLRHSTVLAGLRSISVSAGLNPDDVFIHWVPHFHDMGLFGWLASMMSGAATHTFSPVGFIRRPAAFLTYFAEQGGTLMTGPNFGYDLLLDAVGEELVSGMDLSRWRIAFNGAEPVSAATVAAFAERFAPAGADRSVMYPVYGMAEATLAVTFPQPGTPPRVLHVDRDRLAGAGQVVVVPRDHRNAKAVVSVGRPVAGIAVRLVDGPGEPLGELALGEVQIRGAGVTEGYRDDAANRVAFQDGWFRTGDLAFWHLGELYVAGRLKDMVIVKGQNYFAADVEAVVRDVPGVDRRRCVAVPDDSEHLTIVVEAKNPDDAVAEGVPARIRERISEVLGLTAVRVHVVGRGTLPRTTSGKWQRGLVRGMIGTSP